MRSIVLLVLLLAVGCSTTSSAPQKQGDDVAQPLAALMYLWFGFDLETGDNIGGLKSSHWNTDLGIGSRVGVTDEPVYGFYASDEAAAIARVKDSKRPCQQSRWSVQRHRPFR